MVKGLECFKKHFAEYADQYVLIGGTACTLVMEDVGLNFRATKDFDIVLCVEALNSRFVEAFWQFIKEGDYQNRQKSSGKDLFYRFHSPNNQNFPSMLELFSRVPDKVKLDKGGHLTPIPVDEAPISLSAILLDDEYYEFIHAGKCNIDGLPVVNASHLIPLKAKAWLNLVDEKDARKHRNDVIRLYQLLHATDRIAMPKSIEQDVKRFFECLEVDKPDNFQSLGIKNTSFEEVLTNFKKIYCIE